MKHLLFTLAILLLSSLMSAQDQADTEILLQELEQMKAADRKDKLLLRLAFLFVVSGSALLLIFGTGHRNRKKAEEAQLAASRDREMAMQREQLYVNVTHELRTPLTLIISPLEKLTQESPHPLVYTALRSARELELRFNDILKWNKLEANAMTVQPSVGCLEEEIHQTVNTFSSLAEGKGVVVHFRPVRQGHWIALDFEKLQTILSNLLVNALKFTKQGDEIWVETDFFKEGPSFMLTVRDTGEDIPPDLLGSIFERFTQADKSKHDTIGSGIGLALSKGLAELMGGTIKAISGNGSGAVFSLTLPCQLVEKEEVALQDEPTSNPGSDHKKELMQVLLVEDNPELRDFIAHSFSGAFEILQAPDVPAGMRAAKENLPDIIISDVMLPGGGDGIFFCRELKLDPLTCHIPVLILTARTDFDTKKAALGAGADAYMKKPFLVEELDLTLRSLLENRRRLQEKFQSDLFPRGQGKAMTAPLSDPFLEDAFGQINTNLDNSNFGVEELARAMRISRVQLFKKIKTLTGMPPADLLRNIRLEKAHHLLETGAGNVSQVAYSTGFDNPNYFSKAFKKHFGLPPSDVTPDRGE